MPGLRKRRIRFSPFLVKIWRRLARANFILPLAVTLKRLAAPRLVFILGIVFVAFVELAWFYIKLFQTTLSSPTLLPALLWLAGLAFAAAVAVMAD